MIPVYGHPKKPDMCTELTQNLIALLSIIYDSISEIWVDPSNVELGHRKGDEFAYYRDWAESQGMTQQQFNDYMNNPEFYAWQDIYSNRSHKFEEKH